MSSNNVGHFITRIGGWVGLCVGLGGYGSSYPYRVSILGPSDP